MAGEVLSMRSDVARFDPEREFETPERLKDSLGLTRGQKIAALERWAQQVLDRLAATNEGMPTTEPPGTDTGQLDRINAAIAELKAPNEAA